MATFGKCDIGAVHGHPGGNTLHGSKFTLAENGTLIGIKWYGDDNGLGGDAKCGVYDNSGAGGDAGALKASSNEIAVGAGLGWQLHTIANVPVVAGVYWLYVFHENQISLVRENVANAGGTRGLAYNGLPDPFGAQIDEGRQWSICCEYTPAGISIPVAMHHYGHHISKIIRG